MLSIGYLHLDLADLADLHATLAGDPAPGSVEKLGAASLELIRTWLQRTGRIRSSQ